MSDNETTDGLAEQLMRRALLRELARAPQDDDPPATKLEQVTRAFCDKAIAGDLQAIKEIYDRVDGKSQAGVAVDEQQAGTRTVQWKGFPA
jgi:hypothetical protein